MQIEIITTTTRFEFVCFRRALTMRYLLLFQNIRQRNFQTFHRVIPILRVFFHTLLYNRKKSVHAFFFFTIKDFVFMLFLRQPTCGKLIQSNSQAVNIRTRIRIFSSLLFSGSINCRSKRIRKCWFRKNSGFIRRCNHRNLFRFIRIYGRYSPGGPKINQYKRPVRLPYNIRWLQIQVKNRWAQSMLII